MAWTTQPPPGTRPWEKPQELPGILSDARFDLRMYLKILTLSNAGDALQARYLNYYGHCLPVRFERSKKIYPATGNPRATS